MIVDTSALLAILSNEVDAGELIRFIRDAGECRISTVTRLELAILIERAGGPLATRQADAFLQMARIIEEPVTIEQSVLARQAYYDFARIGLNLGDCYAYSLAKLRDEPLLSKGTALAHTDARRARHTPLRPESSGLRGKP
jgi:ribonuclease VapC